MTCFDRALALLSIRMRSSWSTAGAAALTIACLVTPSLLGSVAIAGVAAHGQVKRPFRVRDSIEMTVLVEPNAVSANSPISSSVYSPDGGQFFVVTKKGDLATGENHYAILLFNIDDVRASIRTQRRASSRTILTLSNRSNVAAISRARWLDAHTIVFLGETDAQQAQLYSVDVATKHVRKLTAHHSRMLDFDLVRKTRRFLFTAETPTDWTERLARGYTVGTENIIDVVAKGAPGLWTQARLFIGELGTAEVVEVRLAPNLSLANTDRQLWMSPSGRWAVAVWEARDTGHWWKEYEPLARSDYFNGAGTRESALFAIGPVNACREYVLIDMQTGDAKSLVGAPTGFNFASAAHNVHWMPQESSVVVVNTFLPLINVRSDEIARRSAAPSVAEVSIEGGTLHRIVDLAVRLPDQKDSDTSIVSSSMDEEGRLTLVWSRGGARERSTYARVSGAWKELSRKRDSTQKVLRGISIEVAQTLNDPPELRAVEAHTARGTAISDFNPQFTQIEMGTVEIMRWSDSTKRSWIGGLLMPPAAEPGRRYPLVIQTHDFNPDLFLIDGPYGSTSGFAARALAARGIAVLQVEDSVGILAVPEESATQLLGYQAAIDTLDRRGVIDRTRVGIHGWSRTGFYVQHALVSAPITFASASVSDPSELGLWPYAYFFGASFPGMLEHERMMGSPLWGTGVDVWSQHDPTLRLDRVRTPLRIEAYQTGFAWWSTYALLRRHARPVEYVSIPNGAHQLVKPWERLTSQEGTVDWHDFWLNDHEDEDSAKEPQYERWRQLRQLHERQLTELPKSEEVRCAGQDCLASPIARRP